MGEERIAAELRLKLGLAYAQLPGNQMEPGATLCGGG
jgi:hypothetical protein